MTVANLRLFVWCPRIPVDTVALACEGYMGERERGREGERERERGREREGEREREGTVASFIKAGIVQGYQHRPSSRKSLLTGGSKIFGYHYLNYWWRESNFGETRYRVFSPNKQDKSRGKLLREFFSGRVSNHINPRKLPTYPQNLIVRCRS